MNKKVRLARGELDKKEQGCLWFECGPERTVSSSELA